MKTFMKNIGSAAAIFAYVGMLSFCGYKVAESEFAVKWIIASFLLAVVGFGTIITIAEGPRLTQKDTPGRRRL